MPAVPSPIARDPGGDIDTVAVAAPIEAEARARAVRAI